MCCKLVTNPSLAMAPGMWLTLILCLWNIYAEGHRDNTGIDKRLSGLGYHSDYDKCVTYECMPKSKYRSVLQTVFCLVNNIYCDQKDEWPNVRDKRNVQNRSESVAMSKEEESGKDVNSTKVPPSGEGPGDPSDPDSELTGSGPQPTWSRMLDDAQLGLTIIGAVANMFTLVVLIRNGDSFQPTVLLFLRHQSFVDTVACVFGSLLMTLPYMWLVGIYVDDTGRYSY